MTWNLEERRLDPRDQAALEIESTSLINSDLSTKVALYLQLQKEQRECGGGGGNGGSQWHSDMPRLRGK